MRKAVLSLFFLTSVFLSFSQSTGSTIPTSSKDEYLRKSGSQKAGAWLLTGASVALLVGSAASGTSNVLESAKPSMVLMAAGAASLGGATYLFIAAARNKRKAGEAAAATSLRIERALLPEPAGMKIQSFPSFVVHIKL